MTSDKKEIRKYFYLNSRENEILESFLGKNTSRIGRESVFNLYFLCNIDRLTFSLSEFRKRFETPLGHFCNDLNGDRYFLSRELKSLDDFIIIFADEHIRPIFLIKDGKSLRIAYKEV